MGDEKIRPMSRYVRSRTRNVPGSSDIDDIDLLTAYEDDAKVGGETRKLLALGNGQVREEIAAQNLD